MSPSFLLKDGLPSYPVPPFISPSFQNGFDMPWWQGREVSRLPEQNSWNLSIQRQLTGSLVLDLSYNGVSGSHLQSGVLNYNQVPFAYSQQFTNAQLGLRFNDPAQAAQIAALGVQLPVHQLRARSSAHVRRWPRHFVPIRSTRTSIPGAATAITAATPRITRA